MVSSNLATKVPRVPDSELIRNPVEHMKRSSRRHWLCGKQGSCERLRGTFHKSSNEYRLFLECPDLTFRQLNRRADRNQRGHRGTRTLDQA